MKIFQLTVHAMALILIDFSRLTILNVIFNLKQNLVE